MNTLNKYLVIDIGGTYTKYAVMDEESKILEKNKIPTVQDSAEHFIDMLVRLFEEKSDAAGIAISAAGVIDSEKGFMYNGGSLACIQNLDIVHILEERCHVPVSIENDARSAGLAEIWKGSLSDCRNAAAMIIGTAVGGAVIVDRKVLTGANCMAGEFSYILTESDHADDPMKTMAMQGGVPSLIRRASARMNCTEETLTGEKIFDAALTGDENAMTAIREYTRELAVAITNIHFILNPERIAIGGGISAQPLLLQLITEELEKLNHVYPFPVPVPKICACQFFNDSNLIGALYVHLSMKKEGNSFTEKN